jgi:hypothetical protein
MIDGIPVIDGVVLPYNLDAHQVVSEKPERQAQVIGDDLHALDQARIRSRRATRKSRPS